ncbi:MAG: hypothetical protein ACTSU5_20200 [Promethearchaeota archaeon]
MSLLDLIVLLSRVATSVAYLVLALFFFRRGKKAREDGISNKFFVGFFFVFLTLFAIMAGLSVYTVLPNASGLEAHFADYDAHSGETWLLGNFYRPLYFLSLIAALFWTRDGWVAGRDEGDSRENGKKCEVYSTRCNYYQRSRQTSSPWTNR